MHTAPRIKGSLCHGSKEMLQRFAVRHLQHVLHILFARRKRLPNDIGNELPNKLLGIDVLFQNLAREETSICINTTAKIGRVERDIDALKGDRCDATLWLDGTGGLLNVREVFVDDRRYVCRLKSLRPAMFAKVGTNFVEEVKCPKLDFVSYALCIAKLC